MYLIGDHPQKYHNYSKEECEKIKEIILKKINFDEVKSIFTFFEYIMKVDKYEEDKFCLNDKIYKEITYKCNEIEKEKFNRLNRSHSDGLEYIELALDKRFDINDLKKDNNYYYYLDIYQEILASKKHDKDLVKEVFLEHLGYEMSERSEYKYDQFLQWIEKNEDDLSLNEMYKKIIIDLSGDPIIAKVKKSIYKKRKILNFFSIKSHEDKWLHEIGAREKNEVSLYSNFRQNIILESDHYNFMIPMNNLFSNSYGYFNYSNIILNIIREQVKLLQIPIDTYTHFRDKNFNHRLIKTKDRFITYVNKDRIAQNNDENLFKDDIVIFHDNEDELENQLIKDLNDE